MVNKSQVVPLEVLEARIKQTFVDHPELGLDPHYVVAHQLPEGTWCLGFYDVKVAPYQPRDVSVSEDTQFTWWMVWSDLQAPYHNNRLITSEKVNPNCLALRHVVDVIYNVTTGESQVLYPHRRKDDDHE